MDLELYTELIYKSLKGELTPEEQTRLEAYSQESGDHLEYREEIELAWQLTGGKEVPTIDVESDLQTMKKRMQFTEEQSSPPTMVVPLWKKFSRIAAAIALLAVAGLGYMLFQNTQNGTLKVAESGATMKHLTLQDGTQVWLNENSTLEFPETFASNVRKIKLDGEAYFEVVRNEAAPFIIEVDESRVQVLGTSFSIKEESNKNQIIVSVQSGRVRLSNQEDSVELTKNEQGIHNRTDRSITKTTTITKNEIVWKTGKFSFREMSLAQAIDKVETFFDAKIEIDNASMKDCGISAIVPATNLEEVLTKIAGSLNMDLKKTTSNSFILMNGECN